MMSSGVSAASAKLLITYTPTHMESVRPEDEHAIKDALFKKHIAPSDCVENNAW